MLAHTLAQNNDPKFQVHMLYHEVVFFTQLASSFMVPWNLLVCAWGNLQYELATMWGHEHTSIAWWRLNYLFIFSFIFYCFATCTEILVICDEPCRILSFFNSSQRWVAVNLLLMTIKSSQLRCLHQGIGQRNISKNILGVVGLMNMHVTRQVKLLCKCDYKFVLLFDNKLSNKKKSVCESTHFCVPIYIGYLAIDSSITCDSNSVFSK